MSNNKYTPEIIGDALKAANGYVYLAARSLGCNHKTIYRHIEKTKWLQELLGDLRGLELDITEQKLRQAILEGEPWAISLKLKTQGKERGYVERSEVTGKDGGEVTIKVVYDDSGS